MLRSVLEPRGLIRTCARCGQVYLRDGKPEGRWTYPRFDPDGRVLTPLQKPRPISIGNRNVSEKLQNASDWTLSWAKRGEPMPPREAAHLAQCMTDIASHVRPIENIPLRLSA